MEITAAVLDRYRERLKDHPVYGAIASLADLRCFMAHHVYSVWDFMSLIKTLQNTVAPTIVPWSPRGDASVRRFINELVLEEESDETMDGRGHTSHFELYLACMADIGADTGGIRRFVDTAAGDGIQVALNLPDVPAPSRDFTKTTFALIDTGKPHVVAAALALGREHIIPDLFRAILSRSGISESDAPAFHWYLNRHVHLDEDFHAPLSLRLLNGLCNGDPQRTDEALAAADRAVAARLAFWDGVHRAIRNADAAIGG